MDDYDRKDEIENIINTLEGLKEDISIYKTEFIPVLEEMIVQANDKLEVLDERISEQERRENEEEERQYWEGVI